MAELKTQRRDDANVLDFLEGIEHQRRREDALTLLPLFESVTGWKATMWGDSIVGFGEYHYHYKSGREGDWPVTGFSPRKQATTIYIMPGFTDYQEQLKRLGKHKHSSSCLYINKLADVDVEVLMELVADAMGVMKERYPVKG